MKECEVILSIFFFCQKVNKFSNKFSNSDEFRNWITLASRSLLVASPAPTSPAPSWLRCCFTVMNHICFRVSLTHPYFHSNGIGLFQTNEAEREFQMLMYCADSPNESLLSFPQECIIQDGDLQTWRRQFCVQDFPICMQYTVLSDYKEVIL